MRRTYDETLHFVLSYDFNPQRLPYLVVELERPSSGCHDAELSGRRAILSSVIRLELAHKLDT